MAEDHSFEDIMQRMQQQEAEQQAQAKAALRALCDRLASLDVTTVNISYDGYGDSGTIDTIAALKGEEAVTLGRELREALHQETCDLLPAGWEINDGSFGELVIDVNSRRVVRQHSWRSTEYDEEEFIL